MSDIELGCRWHFAPFSGGREDGPNDAASTTYKRMPYPSLIRESIQNSLDAAQSPAVPVRMEYTIGRVQRSEFANFFGIRRHIEGCLDYYKRNKDAENIYRPMLGYFDSSKVNERIRYVKISDSGTRGMEYNPGDTSCPFYAFVRSAGVSSKENDRAGGSFGFGKAAYFNISPLRVILVSTMTATGKHFFQGIASLCTHTIDGGEKVVAVGFYDNNGGEPVDCDESIPQPFRRYVPGTSIFIMGVTDDKKDVYPQMEEAVLSDFWMAIHDKRLEVTIGDVTKDKDIVPITADTLREKIEKMFLDDTDRAAYRKSYNPRPYYMAVAGRNVDKRCFYFEKAMPTLGLLRFYAFKNKDAADKIVYMRDPRMVVYGKKNGTHYGFYGVVLCDDPKGNRILREMENPEHNKWSQKYWKVNGKNHPKGKDAEADIRDFVTSAIEKMFPAKDSTVQAIQGLDDFLYIPTAVEADNSGGSSLVGDTTDSTTDTESSPTTNIKDAKEQASAETTTIGKVLIMSNDPAGHHNDPGGSLLAGHGNGNRKSNGGGGTSATNITGRYSSGGGIGGTVQTEIPVRYRSYARKGDGKTVHTIIIHSDFDVTSGRIDLLVGGEQKDEEMPVTDCSQGTAVGNTICGLRIVKGKNVLTLMFADNMRHAIKLKAYEFK